MSEPYADITKEMKVLLEKYLETTNAIALNELDNIEKDVENLINVIKCYVGETS